MLMLQFFGLTSPHHTFSMVVMLKQSENFFHKQGHLIHVRHAISYQNPCHAIAINHIFWNYSLHLDNVISKPNFCIESSLKMHASPCCQNLTVHEFVILPFESSVQLLKRKDQDIKKFLYQFFFRNLHVCSIHSFTKCIIRYRTHVSEKKCGGECKVWLILLSTEKTLCVCTQKQFSLCFPSLLKWDCTSQVNNLYIQSSLLKYPFRTLTQTGSPPDTWEWVVGT